MQRPLQTRVVRILREQSLGILALRLAEAKTGRHSCWFGEVMPNHKALTWIPIAMISLKKEKECLNANVSLCGHQEIGTTSQIQ